MREKDGEATGEVCAGDLRQSTKNPQGLASVGADGGWARKSDETAVMVVEQRGPDPDIRQRSGNNYGD